MGQVEQDGVVPRYRDVELTNRNRRKLPELLALFFPVGAANQMERSLNAPRFQSTGEARAAGAQYTAA